VTVPSLLTPDHPDEVTPLELFFDLVFVFAVSQLSHHLREHLSWRGGAETLVLLLAVYAVWFSSSWQTLVIGADEPRTQRMLLTVMALGLFMNAAVTAAFAASGWTFVVPLLMIQLGRTVWTLVNAPNAVYHEHYVRTLVWLVTTAPLWIVGAAADPQARLLWWGLGAGIDLIGRGLAHPVPGRRLHSVRLPFAGGRMLERCRLFLLIALGETVLAAGTAIAAAPMTGLTVVIGILALVGTVALWALAFRRAGRLTLQYVEATSDPVFASRHAGDVLSVMVAGLIAVAVANEEVIANPQGATTPVLNVLLYGGPILFLLAQGWYFQVALHIWPRLRTIGIAVLVVLGFVTLSLPRDGALLLTSISLAIMAVLDRP
jgi:low temperature requirement protein LtrA